MYWQNRLNCTVDCRSIPPTRLLQGIAEAALPAAVVEEFVSVDGEMPAVAAVVGGVLAQEARPIDSQRKACSSTALSD